MWDVFLSQDVQDFLKKQDHHLQQRLRKGLEKLKCEHPFHYLEHFESALYYKYRIGDYRALIDVDFENRLLKIQVLDHRGVIYKKK